MPADSPVVAPRPAAARWQRWLWLAAGGLSLLLGMVGVFLPLLPTVPFVLLAAFCFSRGSARWEHWLLQHPRLGPPVRQWRERGAVPRRAKLMATTMMAISSAGAWWLIPSPWRWAPGLCCALVAAWLWARPEA